MQLTTKQLEGLAIALKRYQEHEKCTVISGYAGSGKSTLVKFIVSALPVTEDEVCYATFTGKAAQVLLKKGNRNVCTLHKLLYKSVLQPDGKYLHMPVREIDYSIVIVDECSMAPKQLVNLLLSHDCYVIFLGDPGQLPPINPEDDNHLLDAPHVFLDEIMRQALDSEIIRLSMDIREGKPLELMDGKDVKVIDREDLVNGMYLWADQIICAKNETRISINKEMRELLGREGAPQDGDKVICLKNYWETMADNQDPLINGTIGYLQNPYSTFARYPYYINGGGSIDILRANFVSDSDANFGILNMDKKLIMDGTRGLDWKTEYALMKSKKFCHMVPMEFTYGYAITCHKAQGSSWEKILVIEENFPFQKADHARWLYTACTRAEKRLVIVRK